MNKGPLDGIRITDFCQFWAGPYAVTLLTYMGAEAIKIESMKRYDGTRTISMTTGRRYVGLEQSPVYAEISANRSDVSLDLTKPEGVELAKRIIKVSDIVAQNFSPGTMDRLGLGYEVAREIKPDIIYLSSSAVGATGPEWNYRGFAPIFCNQSGASYITGYIDGEPSGMSGRIDLLSAVTSAFAVLAALDHRQRTGEGQHVDVSSTESISVLLGDVLMDYTMNQRSQTRKGNRDDIMAPHNLYRCKGDDKWISIVVATDEEWRAFCDATGNPDWAGDERFTDAYSRKANEEELDRLVSGWTINHTHYEVMELLQRAGVAAMPSFSNAELMSDPHFKARDRTVELEHPEQGKVTLLRPPWKLSETPAVVRSPAALLGQHNSYIFGELLGMSKEEIQRLVDEKVIY